MLLCLSFHLQMIMSTAPLYEQLDGTSVLNIAAYKFAPLKDLTELRASLKELCKGLRLKGTILLSPEGINCFIAGEEHAIQELLEELRKHPGLEDLAVKESFTGAQPFHRMLVKIKKEIIAFGIESVRPGDYTSPKIKAEELRKWLSEGKEVTLLDTRNDYEIALGTFEGAVELGIHHFRDFPKAVAELPDDVKEKPVVMFCTGGIRCEKAGPYMEQAGFRQIFQLDGGILKYFEECGGDHYQGDCFVFDQRVAVGPDLKPTGVIPCFACQATLTSEDIASSMYRVGVSCPKCYRSDAELAEETKQKHQKHLDEVASQLSGCEPHTSRRVIHVPRSFAGRTLIDFLEASHTGYSRDAWMRAILSGDLNRDQKIVSPDLIVREGERFEQLEHDVVEPPVATNIRILHEDDSIIVIDKPAPLPVHPSGRFCKNTLQAFLRPVYHPQKLRSAHRLDANTTGLIVICRKYRSANFVQPQFESRQVSKTYLLRVYGHPTATEWTCDAPIARDPGPIGSRDIDYDDGCEAVTRFELLKKFDDGTSLLKAVPETGRTNQIRLHAWHSGNAIVGDPLYLPNREMGKQSTLEVGAAPMCLHAWKIGFIHPESKEEVVYETSLPEWSDR